MDLKTVQLRCLLPVAIHILIGALSLQLHLLNKKLNEATDGEE